MIFGASRPRHPRPPRPSRQRRVGAETTIVEELPPKLVPSIRQLVSTAIALAHTRLALAGVELEEELQRLISAAVLGLLSLILISLALVVGTFTIIAAVPIENRVAVMTGITFLYVLIAVILVFKLKSIFTDRPPIFGATLAELEKDKETLAHMARAHEAADEARERAGRAEDAFAPSRPSTSASAAGATAASAMPNPTSGGR